MSWLITVCLHMIQTYDYITCYISWKKWNTEYFGMAKRITLYSKQDITITLYSTVTGSTVSAGFILSQEFTKILYTVEEDKQTQCFSILLAAGRKSEVTGVCHLDMSQPLSCSNIL